MKFHNRVGNPGYLKMATTQWCLRPMIVVMNLRCKNMKLKKLPVLHCVFRALCLKAINYLCVLSIIFPCRISDLFTGHMKTIALLMQTGLILSTFIFLLIVEGYITYSKCKYFLVFTHWMNLRSLPVTIFTLQWFSFIHLLKIVTILKKFIASSFFKIALS